MHRRIKLLTGIAIVLSGLLINAPVVSAGLGGHGGFAGHGGFHSGFHGGFHHGFHHPGFHGFHRFGCCFGRVFVGGVFVGASVAYPYYPYPYPAYSTTVYAPEPTAAAVQRNVCYAEGCYHLQGDGVTIPYQWIWVPSAPPPPPAPPTR